MCPRRRRALDPGIHDERFLAATVPGRGTTVLTACSHARVVNVGLEAQRLRPDRPIDLRLGGYHLAGATVEDPIEPTVHDLTTVVAPGIVAPGHCTGWRAAAALASAFGPAGCAPSVVGTRYLLNASYSPTSGDACVRGLTALSPFDKSDAV